MRHGREADPPVVWDDDQPWGGKTHVADDGDLSTDKPEREE